MTVKTYVSDDLDKGIDVERFPTKVVWSTGMNVRFTPGYVSKMLGKSLLAKLVSSFSIREIFSFVGTDGAERHIVCCDSEIYAFNSDFTSYSNITPAPAPTGTYTDRWEFTLVAGLPILTNGKDPIWKWASYGGALSALTGAPTYAKHLSSCLHRLVVSNLSEGGYQYPGRIRWSEAGNPEYWTVGLDNRSGYFDLMHYERGIEAHQTIKGQITDGGKMYFFTERGLWITDFAEVPKGFFIAGKEAELLSSRAYCKHEGTVYWIGKQDIYSAHNGATKPIGLPIRNALFTNLNYLAASRAFSFVNRLQREIWFCIPTGGNNFADTAYIFNYEIGTWGIADVDFSCHSESEYSSLPYDIAGNQHGEILKLDEGYNGYTAGEIVPVDGTVETGDLHFGLPNNVKRISEVSIEPSPQDPICEVMIQVGLRNRLADDIQWSDPMPFTLGVTDFCDFNHFRRDGKYARIRFFSNQLNSPWRIGAYSIKYEIGGTR